MKMKKKAGFDEELCKRMPVNDLIIFAVHLIIDGRKDCTFEALVYKCFSLFPKIFSFSNFPKWPDARKLDRPLRDLRKRNLIKGNPKTSFNLTKRGKRRALEIAKTFRQGKLL